MDKDADRNEYWFFKEEPGKLFVKKFTNTTTNVRPIVPPANNAQQQPEDAEMINTEARDLDEVPDLPPFPDFKWFYYDEEAQFYKLLESCNIKGVRERRLNENLRKVAERLKLKKMKKPKIDASAG